MIMSLSLYALVLIGGSLSILLLYLFRVSSSSLTVLYYFSPLSLSSQLLVFLAFVIIFFDTPVVLVTSLCDNRQVIHWIRHSHIIHYRNPMIHPFDTLNIIIYWWFCCLFLVYWCIIIDVWYWHYFLCLDINTHNFFRNIRVRFTSSTRPSY